MKVFRKSIVFIASIAVLCAVSNTAFANRLEDVLKAGKLTICTSPNFAPYEFLDNTREGQDRFRGADMQLIRCIAKKLGVELEIFPLDFSAVMAAITNGKIDLGISGLSYTPVRARTMELSEPYKKGDEEGIIVRKEDAEKFKSFDDFEGAKVGANSGTLQDQLVTQQLPKAEKHLFDNVANAVLAVSAGKIDAAAVAVPNGEMFMKTDPTLYVLPLRFHQAKSGYVVIAQKGETELIARVNEIIKDVLDKGIYDVWLKEAQAEVAKLNDR